MQRIKRLYLSWRSDQDLIALYQNTSPKVFNKAVKESLRLIFRKDYKTSFFFELKTDPSWPVNKTEEDLVLALSFSNKDDIEIWDAINDAKHMRGSILIKMALRFALGSAYVLGSCLNTEKRIISPEEKQEICYVSKPTRRRRTQSSRKARPVVAEERERSDRPLKEERPQTVVQPKPVVPEEAEEEKPSGMGGFALPGLGSAPSFGAAPSFQEEPQTDAASDGDDFSDDDILSMLDNML